MLNISAHIMGEEAATNKQDYSLETFVANHFKVPSEEDDSASTKGLLSPRQLMIVGDTFRKSNYFLFSILFQLTPPPTLI